VKKPGFLLFFLFSSQLFFSQEAERDFKQQLSFSFGSFRNLYLYPITDIEYASPFLKKVNVRFSGRIRSYGTLFFYSKIAYDITPVADYYFSRKVKPVYFSAGLGLDIRLRLVNDERSEAVNSAEPLLSFAFHSKYKKLIAHVPLWTRFYSNGISFSLLPQVSYVLSERFSVFVRYELSLLSIYGASTHEWRRDCFIGTRFNL
jgi:hypothetical protein